MFSDDDLKRLKERKRSPRISLQVDQMEALLIRLEAAELTLEHFKCYLPIQNLEDCATYKAWLRSKGEKV